MRWLLLVLGCAASQTLGGCRSHPENAAPGSGSTTPLASATPLAPGTRGPSAEEPTEPSAAPELPPWTTGTGAATRLARCGWGALKVDPGVEAPAWAIALVDIDAKQALKGLRVTALELSTASDVVAKLGNRATLRVQEGAVRYSYTAANTREVEPALSAGTYRLRAAAALDRPRKQIAPRKPTRCSVVLTDDSGSQFVASTTADPEWENE
jgi:hypothetical protein